MIPIDSSSRKTWAFHILVHIFLIEKTKKVFYRIHIENILTIGYVSNSKTLASVTCHIHFEPKNLFLRVSKIKLFFLIEKKNPVYKRICL